MNVIPLLELILKIFLTDLSRNKKVSLTILVLCVFLIWSSLQNITTIQVFIGENPNIIFWIAMAISTFVCFVVVLNLVWTSKSTHDLNS